MPERFQFATSDDSIRLTGASCRRWAIVKPTAPSSCAAGTAARRLSLCVRGPSNQDFREATYGTVNETGPLKPNGYEDRRPPRRGRQLPALADLPHRAGSPSGAADLRPDQG